MSDNFEYKLLEKVLDHDKKNDNKIAKVLSLTNELPFFFKIRKRVFMKKIKQML